MGRHSLILGICLICPVLTFASGGGEKTDKPSSPPPEWVEIQSRLQTLKAKLSAKEKTVRELIAAKHHGQERESFEHLKKEHAELRQLAQEYERQRNVLKYRYPEKGLKDERKYRRVEVKSLSDMENQIGMESVLQKTQNKILRQYGSTDGGSDRTPASENKGSSNAPEKSTVDEGVTVPAVMSK
ncbi:MAG TPA: hypothetical protein PL182_07260 [Pseudobdellovibrionaceae bacterium]|nr:hypothetical protein [Pseudobdellovibrionaceae bacterium]